MDHEVKIFTEWWAQESKVFKAYMTVQLGVPVDVETIEFRFIDDFDAAMISVIVTSSAAISTVYIIVTRPGGEWNANSLIEKDTYILEDQPEDTEEEDNEQEL